MNTEYFYYGQGKIYLAPIDPVTLAVGASAWVGDVSVCTPKLTTQQVKHRESYSGQNSLVRSFPVSKEGTIDLTMHKLSADNLALALYGTKNPVVTGTVTSETFATGVWTVGNDVLLANPGTSLVVITDSTPTTPKTLVLGTDYTVDNNFGRITVLNVTGYVAPYKVSYSYSARTEVGIFTSAQPLALLRYEGINLAQGNAAVISEFYKVAINPLQELLLLTSGTDVAGLKLSMEMLIDSSRPSTGVLGQFGKLITVG